MNIMQILRLLPLLLLLAISAVLSTGLLNHNTPQSLMVGKPLPDFNVELINDPKISLNLDSFRGQVVILNVFASWCKPCQAEHDNLMKLAHSGKVNVYGIAWRDKAEKVAKFITAAGNPYQMIGFDPDGRTTIPLSLTGVPETLVIDRDGLVKYHQVSAITDDDVNERILPLVEKLNAAHVSGH